MELVQKLARRFWRWQLVPDQTPHAIPAQTGEVIQTFSSGSIEDGKTLHLAGFIQAALALLDTHMAPDASRQVQTSERLHQQRNPGQRGQVLFAVSFVIIESQRLLGRGNTFCSHLAAFYGLPSPNRCELPTLPHPSGLDSNRYSTSPTDGLRERPELRSSTAVLWPTELSCYNQKFENQRSQCYSRRRAGR